jgi:hypothetical protein
VARGTPHLRKPFAVIGIGGERGRCGQQRWKHQANLKQLHAFLRPIAGDQSARALTSNIRAK